MSEGLSLSVLDFDFTLSRAIRLAPAAESFGYVRYWFAEHPPQPSAEMLVALAAGMTSTLRIGTGGVVLRFRNVFQSVTNFLFLTRAYGDRIDAGICNGSVDTADVATALGAVPGDFDDRARSWVSLLRADVANDPLGSARQFLGPAPEIWLMGTGPRSATMAAELGVSYAYSLFHQQSVDDPAALRLYRSMFRPTEALPAPRTMLAIAGVCAGTDLEAQRRIEQAGPSAISIKTTVAGSVESCRTRLRELRDRHEMDELIILEQSPTIEESIDSLERFAQIARS